MNLHKLFRFYVKKSGTGRQVEMSRMIASYDGEGCTCENGNGDAGSEDQSLAGVH